MVKAGNQFKQGKYDKNKPIICILPWCFSKKKVPIEFLELDVIKDGCFYLNLYDCILKGSELALNQELKVKYLSLSGCNIKEQVLETFLASCHFLEKLSFEGLTLNQNMINNICLQNGKTLTVLNLHRTRGLELESIETITSNLQGISHYCRAFGVYF